MPAPLIPFDYTSRTRILFGLNSIDRLGELTRDIGAQRALMVTDPGIVAAVHVNHAVNSLESAGIQAVVFDRVHENHTTREVDACLGVANAGISDGIIGVGGAHSSQSADGLDLLLP